MKGEDPHQIINMAVQSQLSFISYNSTGFTSLKREWIRDLLKTTNATFINLQEHFRKNKNVEKLFKDEFPDFNSYVIPGFRADGQDNGRPKGGLAQLKGCPKKTSFFKI